MHHYDKPRAHAHTRTVPSDVDRHAEGLGLDDAKPVVHGGLSCSIGARAKSQAS